MKKQLFHFVLFLIPYWGLAQTDSTGEVIIKITVDQYIEKYSAIAVDEMYRSKIPASITLAQGILESGNGNSRLAREANNHFGIKCK
jgi:flagellum-specific peptidoglycan hydrolase FlgJ